MNLRVHRAVVKLHRRKPLITKVLWVAELPKARPAVNSCKLRVRSVAKTRRLSRSGGVRRAARQLTIYRSSPFLLTQTTVYCRVQLASREYSMHVKRYSLGNQGKFQPIPSRRVRVTRLDKCRSFGCRQYFSHTRLVENGLPVRMRIMFSDMTCPNFFFWNALPGRVGRLRQLLSEHPEGVLFRDEIGKAHA